MRLSNGYKTYAKFKVLLPHSTVSTSSWLMSLFSHSFLYLLTIWLHSYRK